MVVPMLLMTPALAFVAQAAPRLVMSHSQPAMRSTPPIAMLSGIDAATLLAAVPDGFADVSAGAAAESSSFEVAASLMGLCIAAFIGSTILSGATDTEAEEQPGHKEAQAFGWLQADLRMPLPSFAELKDACHLVGSWKGNAMFLCSSPQQMGATTHCEQSADFTEYYGQPVYVCEGSAMSMEIHEANAAKAGKE